VLRVEGGFFGPVLPVPGPRRFAAFFAVDFRRRFTAVDRFFAAFFAVDFRRRFTAVDRPFTDALRLTATPRPPLPSSTLRRALEEKQGLTRTCPVGGIPRFH
jgi:hypothetical protein